MTNRIAPKPARLRTDHDNIWRAHDPDENSTGDTRRRMVPPGHEQR
jgi:hypothetical protein